MDMDNGYSTVFPGPSAYIHALSHKTHTSIVLG